jgi:hypothetical protein
MAFSRFQVANDLLVRIRDSTTQAEASAAYDLDVRRRLALLTCQDPEKVADVCRLISDIELWNEIALKCGATQATKVNRAKSLKLELSLIVERRNKIAHEADLQPGALRSVWPICDDDLRQVRDTVLALVTAMDQLL